MGLELSGQGDRGGRGGAVDDRDDPVGGEEGEVHLGQVVGPDEGVLVGEQERDDADAGEVDGVQGEQGTTTMPAAGKDPEAMAAPRSFSG